MPRQTRRAGRRLVTSSPSKTILPALGVRNPLMRLKKVVLPAPLGPITARSSPGSTVNDTPLTATRLPNVRVTFSTLRRLMRRASLRRPAADDAEHAAREEQHDQHEEEADERHPVFGLARDVILQHDEDRGADERSPERAHAAQHRHDDEIARLVPAQRARIDEVAQKRVERAGEADEEARDHPRHPDVPVDRNAEEARAALILADREQGAP